MGLRDFCVGSIAGATLSLSRPPAGITIEEWMSPSGARQGLWRAGALTVVAAALLCQRSRREGARFPAIELALGALFGFALHGFVLVDVFSIDTQFSWLVALVTAGSAMFALRGRSPRDAPDERADSTPRLLRISLALSGAGLAVVISALNSRACLLGAGTRDDETIFAATGLALFALGALAFGPLLAARPWNRSLLPIGLAFAAGLALFSFDFLHALSLPKAYDKLLEQFGLNSGLRGTFVYDALIAARVFALPCLLAGIAFASARDARELAFALLGAAAAAVISAHAPGFDATTLDAIGGQAGTRAAAGGAIVAVGALLAAMIQRQGALKWRMLHLVLPAAPVLALLVRSDQGALPLSPWEKIPPRVEWMRETPEGLLTVEFQVNRGMFVTLDRRRLTPTTDELAGDETRLRRSLEVLAPVRSLVLAGVLTPERAAVLRSGGFERSFVTSPWPDLQAELEAKLFELAGQVPAVGLALEDDHRRGTAPSNGPIAAIALPVDAAARTCSGLEWDLSDLVRPRIGWLSAQQDIAQLDWGKDVLVSCGHLDDLAIGVVRGDPRPESAVMAGAPRASRSWKRLASVDITQREFNARSRVAERLMRAAKDPVMDALERLCDAQKPSSPFETRAQRTELDSSAIDLLRKSGLAAEPKGFDRELDEFVATTLKGKRDLEGLGAFAQPLADAYPTWAGMQRAAAAADWEFMQWSRAARRLERVVDETFPEAQAQLWLIEALLRADEAPAALTRANVFFDSHPERLDAQKLHAIAALRAGDSHGREWLDILLREHPDDAELAPYAALGSIPPLWPSQGIPGEVP